MKIGRLPYSLPIFRAPRRFDDLNKILVEIQVQCEVLKQMASHDRARWQTGPVERA